MTFLYDQLATSCQDIADVVVPQGSLMGPFMFQVIIKSLTTGIDSNIKLLADDYIIYKNE